MVKSDEPPTWVTGLIVIILSISLIWEFWIKPVVFWVNENLTVILLVSTIVVAVITTGFYYLKKYEEEENNKKRKFEEAIMKEKRAFEEEQNAKGLTKFTDSFGNEKWGTSTEVENWELEDKKQTLVYRVTDAIERFAPVRKHTEEYSYQLELVGWLRAQFPSATIEEKRGSTRPDIVIDDIAVEVKGPTGSAELATISDKCMRYPNHYEKIIVVLFDLTASKTRYDDWIIGLERTFPNAKVIRK